MTDHHLRGTITSAGFASGDRFVVGVWEGGPLGPMADVMWARPDGERVLLVPHADVGDFITAVYAFDRVEVVDLRAVRGGCRLEVVAGELRLALTASWFVIGPGVPRPLWFTRHIEAPIAERLLGVHPYGTSPTGVHEWYRARWVRPVRRGVASLGELDLGALRPVDPPVGFGFSEPPTFPSMVGVSPVLRDPSGRLDAVLASRTERDIGRR